MSELPIGWTSAPLRDLTLPIAKVVPIDTGRETIRYIDIGSVEGERHALNDVQEIFADGAPSRARQLVAGGDTVFSTVRPYLEKIAYIDDSLHGEFASTGFSVLRPGPSLVPKYLFYFSISKMMLDQVLPLQKGVSYPAVLDKEVRSAIIPLPPLAEQREIVKILEFHFSRLDSAEAGLRAAALRGRALVNASAATLVGHAEADEMVPQVRLSDIAKIGSGSTPKRGVGKYWTDGTIPWITSGDLAQGVITSATQFVTEAALAETSVKFWPAGTLLVAMYGEGKTRGTVAELKLDATTNQACAAITLDDSSPVVRAWLRLVLESRYDALRRESSGGVQPNLTLGYFKSLSVPWPGSAQAGVLVDEHHAIVRRAQRLDQCIRGALNRSERLRRALLFAAFSGKLTGMDTDIERVEEVAGV